MSHTAKIKLSSITFGSRLRSEYGDISALADSIQEHGLLTAITVEKTDKGKYLLLAGGRRVKACEKLKITTIPAIIYENLSHEERRLIELEENIKREDLTFVEIAAIRAEIHRLKVKESGGIEGVGGPKTEHSGWGRKDTAEYLGVAPSTLTGDLQIDEAAKAGFTEVKKARTRGDALKIVEGISARGGIVTVEERSETDKKIYNLIRQGLKDAYFMVDEKDMPVMGKAPDGKWDFIEINVSSILDHIHVESTVEFYLPFLTDTGWLMLTNCDWIPVDFEKHKLYNTKAIWTWQIQKGDDPLLSNNYESLIFISHDNKIQEKGRSNIFQCPKPRDEQLIHTTEHPIELMEMIIKTFIPPTGKVFVPRLISGNTLHAAANLEMQALGYGTDRVYKELYCAKVDGSEPKKYKTLI